MGRKAKSEVSDRKHPTWRVSWIRSLHAHMPVVVSEWCRSHEGLMKRWEMLREESEPDGFCWTSLELAV